MRTSDEHDILLPLLITYHSTVISDGKFSMQPLEGTETILKRGGPLTGLPVDVEKICREFEAHLRQTCVHIPEHSEYRLEL